MKIMNPRERVFAALGYVKPDFIPLEYYPSAAGCYEHGQKLKELWRVYPQDFGCFSSIPIPRPDPKDFDKNGRYHRFETDDWGVEWEHRIFGISGQSYRRPLDDLKSLGKFQHPRPPVAEGPEFEVEKNKAFRHKVKYFLKSGWISIFQIMHAVRKMEDVLVDLAMDMQEIHCIADVITAYQEEKIKYLLALGVDAIQFGDDFGTQSSLMISREVWRHFFMPRYARLMEPVRDAGVKIFFHSCGYIADLIEDFKTLGVNAVWPQLCLYNISELAAQSRDLKLAVAVQIDRSHLMTRGSPLEIQQAVKKAIDLFQMQEGGSWFYVEIDNGFPFENVKALFEAIGEYRKG